MGSAVVLTAEDARLWLARSGNRSLSGSRAPDEAKLWLGLSRSSLAASEGIEDAKLWLARCRSIRSIS